MDAPSFPEAGIIDYFTHMLLLWIWWHIMIEEPGKEQKKLTGVIRLMQQMANVERDEDCSVVMGNEVLQVVTRFGLPVFPMILPGTMRVLNAPEKTAPHP
jgi:hypothetical protein